MSCQDDQKFLRYLITILKLIRNNHIRTRNEESAEFYQWLVTNLDRIRKRLKPHE